MKRLILKFTIFSSLLLFLNINIKAQNSSKVIFDALNTEIKRAMDSLKLEKMPSPKFISFDIVNAQFLQVKSILGGIIKSELKDINIFNNRILVGDSGRTNENYLDESILWSWDASEYNMPNTNNVNSIRRAFWLATDSKYKTNITSFQSKISAINQQNIPINERNLIDFSNAPKNIMVQESENIKIDKVYFENLAKKLSVIFKNYPKIQESETNIFVYNGTVCFANSEGTQVKYPITITAVKVTAVTQAVGGEELKDHYLVFVPKPSNLPDEKTMIDEVTKVASNLTSLIKVNPITEPYCGPVLFEDQAAAEVFIQQFFNKKNGMVTVRKPILGSAQIMTFAPDRVKENSLESMINKKVVSRDLSVVAMPLTSTYKNIPLVGSYKVDAEGVIPSDKNLLIENGVLKTLLNGRVPSLKIQNSNGHSRIVFDNSRISTFVGPGVIQMNNSNATTKLNSKQLKEKLISLAKEEDLEYAYIVRKVVSYAAGFTKPNEVYFFGQEKKQKDVSSLIEIYRVDVKTGKEELVRGAEIQSMSVKLFKQVVATSDQEYVYNTMLKAINNPTDFDNGELNGFACSFIIPSALLFKELDIVTEKFDVINKTPVVSNPLIIK